MRLPPMELRPGEALFINWPGPGQDVEFSLRRHLVGGGHIAAHTQYSADAFRRPPTSHIADQIRGELTAGLSDIERGLRDKSRRSNRQPKKPRW